MVLQQYGGTELWQYDIIAVQHHGSIVWQYYSTAIRYQGSTVSWQNGSNVSRQHFSVIAGCYEIPLRSNLHKLVRQVKVKLNRF